MMIITIRRHLASMAWVGDGSKGWSVHQFCLHLHPLFYIDHMRYKSKPSELSRMIVRRHFQHLWWFWRFNNRWWLQIYIPDLAFWGPWPRPWRSSEQFGAEVSHPCSARAADLGPVSKMWGNLGKSWSPSSDGYNRVQWCGQDKQCNVSQSQSAQGAQGALDPGILAKKVLL